MRNLTCLYAVTFAMALISGCAPTGGDSNNEAVGSDSSPAEINSTSDLVADEDFDFKSERTVLMSFDHFPSDYGTISIYLDYEYFDANLDEHYPDYDTRIATYGAQVAYDYAFVIPSAQQHLVVEWLPMDGASNEAYARVALSDDERYLVRFD